ncbi:MULTISPECIES: hypothetical protein [unclassified Streptomyces]|uniref:hypothetical protein n=1 Tax=unclassified Streptomyces TaxID=2593676 RepID=UPI003D94368A
MTKPTDARISRWSTAAWAALLVLGGFNALAALLDLMATAGTGLPADHSGTFTRLVGVSWAGVRAQQPGTAHYITLLERGYVLHELPFALLFLAIVSIPFRARQRWAWWSCWAVLIAYGGYALTFGAHDPTIMTRAALALAALAALLLAHIPAFFRRARV